ncbi:MAG: DUF4276 family protein [Bryobacteraceae bacterium]
MPSAEGTILRLIVEGHSEEQAAPVLIRRLAQAFGFHSSIRFAVRRVTKSRLIQPGELEKTLEALARQIGRSRPFLVLLDADEDCPKDLADDLKARCRDRHADLTIAVVIANKEYEAWFLAAAKSLSGKGALDEKLHAPDDPESVQGAKEWLTARMLPNESYSPTRHQPAYSHLMDLSEAGTARSFRKFEKEVARLLGWNRRPSTSPKT